MVEQHLPRCHYHYDPLDRLTGRRFAERADTRLFYRKQHLATQVQGGLHDSLLQAEEYLLAQIQPLQTSLLATDQARSVLRVRQQAQAYTPYGHLLASGDMTRLAGFNGECRDPVTGHYLLGNGYRAFNPVLMRFNSPDNLSPFDEGGLNAYAYCQGDPVNVQDPTGHMQVPRILLKKIDGTWYRSTPTPAVPAQEAPVPSTSQARAVIDNGIEGGGEPLRRSTASESTAATASSSRGRVVESADETVLTEVERVSAHKRYFKYLPDRILRNMSQEQLAKHVKKNGFTLSRYHIWGEDTPGVKKEKLVRYHAYMLSLYKGPYGKLMRGIYRNKGIWRNKAGLKKAKEDYAKARMLRRS